jgi:hypothetical protein
LSLDNPFNQGWKAYVDGENESAMKATTQLDQLGGTYEITVVESF